MDVSITNVGLCAICFLSWSVIAHADHDSSAALSLNYQVKRLLAPSSAQLATEQRGGVYIYDSLTMGQVNTGLDQHFDRMQNMMFIRIHHPPPAGTGPMEVEDDDCD